VKQVGRELGVRYVLEGSVRKAGQRVRITGQLIDAVTGRHLWADRFDGSLEDVFELQDKVASSVAGVIEPALQAAEMRRSAARPTTDLTAYDLYLRAHATVLSSARQVPEARLTKAQQPPTALRFGWNSGSCRGGHPQRIVRCALVCSALFASIAPAAAWWSGLTSRPAM
jgi:hypothetical protein